jgi:hypothetical protein
MAKANWQCPSEWSEWSEWLAAGLHARNRWRLTLLLTGIDDSPTKRHGPKVEGAAIHHNPTPGPADQKYLYGHIWVTLSLALRHPLGDLRHRRTRFRLTRRNADCLNVNRFRFLPLHLPQKVKIIQVVIIRADQQRSEHHGAPLFRRVCSSVD